ncbi:MAG TPA: cyclic-di-AMP receptor [Fimbriimonas sp.]|nr:cyclic-di-AMP receptor [Fimbriimonas sp.]
MKLAVCIVHNRDRSRITDELVKAGFKFTVIGSTGGFLREGNTTILIGVEEADLPGLEKLIGQNCQSREQLVNVMPFEAAPPGAFIPSPVKVPVGGAVMFVLNVEQFLRF